MERNSYPVVIKAYNLTIWYIKKLQTIPRNHRFTIGQKIENELLELNLTLTYTIYSKNKREFLRKANRHVEKLRLLSRLLRDLNLISQKNHIFIAESVNEVGSMVGGWLKNV
jgi:hypothetical protein